MIRQVLGFAGLMALAGCGSGGDDATKVGADVPAAPPRTVTMATPDLALTEGEGGLRRFVDAVGTRSGGRLRIKPVLLGDFDEATRLPLTMHRERYDLAYARARDLGAVVPAAEVVTLPLLIDSYALQRALVARGLADRMLSGLPRRGLLGVGVLPGELVLPWSIGAPVTDERGWRRARGITMFGQIPPTVRAAYRALGTRTVRFEGNPQEVLLTRRATIVALGPKGVANSPIAGYGMVATANLSLGPRMLVLYGNGKRLERLSERERGWLRAAAADAAGGTPDLAAEGTSTLAGDCKSGVRAALATDGAIAAMRAKVLPLYRAVDDAPARDVVAFVEEVRADVEPERATVPRGCAGPLPELARPLTRNADPHALDGTYRYTTTMAQYRRLGLDDVTSATFAGQATVTLRGGRATIRIRREKTTFGTKQPPIPASYKVDGDRVTLIFNGPTTVRWKRDEDGGLRFSTDLALDPLLAPALGQVWRRLR